MSLIAIKKESPNEGTETWAYFHYSSPPFSMIKKESPNEGTETIIANNTATARIANKKRIPEWGDGNHFIADRAENQLYKKRIPEWGDGNEKYGCHNQPAYGIKKESPNEGTETTASSLTPLPYGLTIKKESPNEGTETLMDCRRSHWTSRHKKRIPEWGDGNHARQEKLSVPPYS